jgi:two-component system OmpR family sensor kinase
VNRLTRGPSPSALWSGAVLAPVAGGLVLAVVWWLWGPSVRVTGAASPALLLAEAGVVTGIVVALTRRARQRADDEARDRAGESERVRAGAQADAEQRVHAERLRLLSRLDHELKNPLMAMRLGLANLRADGSADALALVEQQAARIGALLSDLRKVTDVERLALDVEDVDLAAVLDEVRASVAGRPGADERTWELVVPRAPWPVPRLRADADLLFLALHNLADNALKYSRPGDHIELRVAEESDTHVVVEVADTGAGIPAGEVEAVWEELARASTSRGVPGTGLGLPLVRMIARRHGGGAELRSREGHGTVVRLRLPVAGPPLPVPAAGPPLPVPAAGPPLPVPAAGPPPPVPVAVPRPPRSTT